MGRLGLGVWASARFQIFALTAGEMSWAGREIVRAGDVRWQKCPTLQEFLPWFLGVISDLSIYTFRLTLGPSLIYQHGCPECLH